MLNSESGQASCVSKRVSQPSLAATGSTGNDDVLVESDVIIGSQSVEQRSIDLAICIPVNLELGRGRGISNLDKKSPNYKACTLNLN